MRPGLLRRLPEQLKARVGPSVARRQPVRQDLPRSLWDLDVGPEGHLRLGGVDLEMVAQAWGTPLHVVDLHRLDAAAEAALEPLRRGTGADVYYSYKTNPVAAVLRRLHAHGIGAEVISGYELWLALRLGVAPARIIFSSAIPASGS